ncbi:hypothetical protein BDV23DRAFT_186706 [Aspergillus alliaceus]|uniref:Kelch repeat protein n=1 Tax=Petromyces alliaceus TaxID=209559 RepID=A0A5N7BZG2_PETAA|nr:hypothetical protein BDV23DRAFT_186706 [Aspergillus alliaceus]
MSTRNLFVFLWLAGLSFQQQEQEDLLKNFCRIFGHQTAVIDRKLYIDGGFVNYNPLSQYPRNYTHTGLLNADFDVDNEGMPAVYNNLTKPTDAPDVNGGILWSDAVNKMLYLYGGEFSQGTPQNFSMWTYDALYNKWKTANPDITQANIQRASYGSGVTLQDRGVGYYYGGWLSNASVPAWGSRPPMALSSLLEYDMVHNTWMNSTGPDSVGRAEGAMVYIPASEGMLVYFGGVKAPQNNGTTVGQPMDEILLYDISDSKWYTQKATGQVPEQRRRFCAGATWAQDYSSYNIYLYGGLGVPAGVGFDDIYILSLPSFRWIKWYPDAAGAGYPKHSASCTVVDGAQMIVMGGTYTNSTTCDVPKIYGLHNMYLGKQNPEHAMWARFRPNLTSYQVPSEIISVVGGSGTGGATTKAPSNGFDDRDLQVYFQRVYTPTTRTPTRAIPTSTSSPSDRSPSKSTPVGAIVGGVLGGVFGLLIVAALLYYFLRFRRKKESELTEQQQQPQPQEEVKDPPPPDINELPGQQEYRRSELYGSQLVELPCPEGEAVAAAMASRSPTSPSNSTPYSPSASPPPPPPAYHNRLSEDNIAPATPVRGSATSS